MNAHQSHQKYCPKCKTWLSFVSFGVLKSSKDGLRHWCKDCFNKYRRENISSETIRKWELRRKFNITPKQYDRMFADQGGLCAACKMPEAFIDYQTGLVKTLCVDHDHKTGDVRKLLCHACNISLGAMEESPERIRGLAEYAEWCQAREPDVKIVQISLL